MGEKKEKLEFTAPSVEEAIASSKNIMLCRSQPPNATLFYEIWSLNGDDLQSERRQEGLFKTV